MIKLLSGCDLLVRLAEYIEKVNLLSCCESKPMLYPKSTAIAICFSVVKSTYVCCICNFKCWILPYKIITTSAKINHLKLSALTWFSLVFATFITFVLLLVDLFNFMHTAEEEVPKKYNPQKRLSF